jgi:predicted transcriptional regulator
MKIKKIHVEIKTLDDTLREAGKIYNAISKGKETKKKTTVYFSTVKDMRRALTEKRLELLKAIKDRRPSSIYELAKLSGRDLKNVLQDVSYLRELGIIDVVDLGDKKVPKVHYDVLAFEVAI